MGLALISNYLAAPANPGTGGYAFSYEDTSGSIVCLDGCPASGAVCTPAPATSMLCALGSPLLANATAPYAAFGGGIGFSLNQPMATGGAAGVPMPFKVPAASTGITYTVSSVPAHGLRVQIDHLGATYCAPAPTTATAATVLWSDFNTACYDMPPDGTQLAGPPNDATQIEFQMVTTSTAGTGDFCVIAVSFAK